jgi:hypothetical protein
MSLGTRHQSIEFIGDAKLAVVVRMLGAEVLQDGPRASLLPTRPEDRVDVCDFVKRLSPETQRILSEFKQL